MEEPLYGPQFRPFSYIPSTLERYIVFLSLFIFIIIDHYEGRSMFLTSINVSIHLQEYSLYNFSMFMSYGYFIAMNLYFPVRFFLKKDRSDAFFLLFAYLASTWALSLLKLFFLDSRPSFESRELHEGGGYCENEYGKPSGHAFMTSILSALLVDDFRSMGYKLGSLAKAAFVGGNVLLVGFSRVHLGVHSLNQIVLGLLFGLQVYFVLCLIKNWVHQYLIRPIKPIDELAPLEQPKPQRELTVRLLLLVVAFNIPSALIYFNAQAFETDFDPMFEKIINCSYVKERIHRGFAMKIFSQATFVNFFFFLLLGANYSHFDFYSGSWLGFDRNRASTFFRLLIAIVGLSFLALQVEPPPETRTEYFLKSLIVPPSVGFLIGRFFLTLLHSVRIKFAKSTDFI